MRLIATEGRIMSILVLQLLLFAAVLRIEGRTKSPLLDDSDTRLANKAAECVFGTQIKDLGSTWIPDLGAPIGVLFCMRCECVKTHRKRRIVARVQCKSIKNECPEPKCSEPVLLKGNCCKTCPGDTHSDVVQDIVPQNAVEEEEKNTKHYGALLTGRSSLVMRNDDLKPIHMDNKNNVVATGRFVFQKRSLYFSFYVSDKAARPRSLQFMDQDANILEEMVLSESGGVVSSVYQNATRKVCGVWKRMPRDYRRLLKEERLYVVLVWGVKDQNEFMLSGQVARYAALGTELFSSLLEPAPSAAMQGAGGTAIIYTSTTLTPSIHIALVFNGIFDATDTGDVPVEITLAMDERKTPILREVRNVTKPAPELNIVELSAEMNASDIRMMSRGRLYLSMASVARPHLKLVGNIMTKATCELFQSTLAPTTTPTTSIETNGLAWIYLNSDGALVYNIQIDGIPPELITLSDVTQKRKTELLDITSSYSNGWANGTLDKVSPKILEPLYGGNLWVNVAKGNVTLAKGKLSAKMVAEARDAPAPFLLRREIAALSSSAVGMAWINIDAVCNLHYDITISGISTSPLLNVTLEMLPMIAPGAPVITRHLGEAISGTLEGSTTDILRREELNRLDSGVAFLKVKDRHSRTLLAATVKQIKVPSACLPQHPDDNDLPYNPAEESHSQSTTTCYHLDEFYAEESSWTSKGDPCVKCFCQNGNVRCDTDKCPELHCPHGRKTHAKECCAVCVNGSTQTTHDDIVGGISNRCSFGGQTYSSGAKFNPFLIPNGFDTCIECVCERTQVKCERLKTDKCCTGCQPQQQENPPPVDSLNGTYLSDHAHHTHHQSAASRPPRRPADVILREGGCENPINRQEPYENERVYHPVLASLGEYKCVTCKCQNGQTTCHRPRCTKEMCEKLRKSRKAKTHNANDAINCCLKDCKRLKRHPNRSNRNKS